MEAASAKHADREEEHTHLSIQTPEHVEDRGDIFEQARRETVAERMEDFVHE